VQHVTWQTCATAQANMRATAGDIIWHGSMGTKKIPSNIGGTLNQIEHNLNAKDKR
jgi:hypothetical protein